MFKPDRYSGALLGENMQLMIKIKLVIIAKIETTIK